MAGPDRIVIDASVALDWFDPAGRGAYAAAVRQAIDRNQIQPIAPVHFDHECAAVLMRWYRSNKITRARLEFACNQLAALQIQIHAYPSNAAELVALALRCRLTPFDAVYFDMAVTEAVPIATLDGGLMQAAKSFKIKHWQP